MRILFDGFWWVAGPHANRQVLRELVLGWERAYPADELVVAVRHRDLVAARAELPDRVEVVTTRLWPQGVSAIVELPLLARRARVDVTLTHNFTPLLGRSCVFVHDLMFETNPEWFTAAERLYFSLMTRTVPRADLVLTSTWTEARRIDAVSRPRRPAQAVGLGVPSTLRDTPPQAVPGTEDLDGFLVVVGRLNVRKNLVGAIEGALASGRVTARRPVLVAGESGGKGVEFPPSVRQAVDRGEVRFLGFVPDSQLAWLYRHADLFLFLSLDEGFGIPALEGPSFGTPALLSDIDVFHEVVGDRVHYADPRDPAAISAAVASALDAVATNGRPAGFDPADLGYSWPRVVARLRAGVASVVPAAGDEGKG